MVGSVNKKWALLGNVNSGKSAQRLPVDMPQAYTRNEDEALEALKDFGEIDVLAVHGGDGTLDTTIKLMRAHNIFKKEPAIALLKGGTTNMTHRDIGLDKIGDLNSFTTRKRHVIKVQRAGAADEYGFFFGLGAIPRAIGQARSTLHNKGMTGPLGEAALAASLFWRLLSGKPHGHHILEPSALRYNDSAHENVFFIATTLERLLLGMNPTPPNGSIGCAALQSPYRQLWCYLPAMLSDEARVLPEDCGLERFNQDDITLSFDGAWTLDGELFEASSDQPVTLSKDRAIDFVVES